MWRPRGPAWSPSATQPPPMRCQAARAKSNQRSERRTKLEEENAQLDLHVGNAVGSAVSVPGGKIRVLSGVEVEVAPIRTYPDATQRRHKAQVDVAVCRPWSAKRSAQFLEHALGFVAAIAAVHAVGEGAQRLRRR